MNTNGQDAPKKNKSRWTGIVNANSTYRFFFFFRPFCSQRFNLELQEI